MNKIPKGYKQTEVGVIPEDWGLENLRSILKIIGGGSFKSKDSCTIGIRWLKIANVGKNKIIWDEESYLPLNFIKEYDIFLLKEGDLVVALTRPIIGNNLKIAKINAKDSPCLLNQRVGKIEAVNNNIVNYIYFLLQKDEIIKLLLQSIAGTDPPNLSNNAIYSIISAFPPTPEEQSAIAAVLSDMDAEIEQLERKPDKYKQIKQGMMQELLTGKTRLI